LGTDSLKVHVKQLELNLLKPNIRTSPENLSKLLTDDFFEFGSSGDEWWQMFFHQGTRTDSQG